MGKVHRRTVTAKTSFGLVHIEVYANVEPGHLMLHEQKKMIDDITDANMQTLANARHVRVPLSKLKVT